MDLDLTVQIASDNPTCPDEDTIRSWLKHIDTIRSLSGEMTVRIVGEKEGTQLNHEYRDRAGPTNVLSFAYNDESSGKIMGDIVICAPVVEREAREQNKDCRSHWAHMVIHGTLHLMGYDHIDETDAVKMETLEQSIMAEIGYDNPYRGEQN